MQQSLYEMVSATYPQFIFWRGYHDQLRKGDELWKVGGGKTSQNCTGCDGVWGSLQRQAGAYPPHES